jgi:hypothetical protein
VKKIVRLLCIAALCLQSMDGNSFWSDPIYPTHQKITKTALTTPNWQTGKPFCYSGDICAYFSDSAVTAINNRHLMQDNPLVYNIDDHFDANNFAGSLTKMVTNRKSLNNILNMRPITVGGQDQMWKLLGNILHAAEDFYAHSTWVDEGTSKIINFGPATKSDPPTNIFSLLPAGPFCGSEGFPLLPVDRVNFLITGYYPPETPSKPSGGCLHGDTLPNKFLYILGVTTPSLYGLCGGFVDGTQNVPGIAHDVACDGKFIPTNTVNLHNAIACSIHSRRPRGEQ